MIINTENTNKKIEWSPENFETSEFKKVLRPEVASAMSDSPLSYFAHHFGFDMEGFTNDPNLNSAFKVVNYYRKFNKKIVSAIEHRSLPIFGVQFHPEKILFEHHLKVRVNLTRFSAMAAQELGRIIFNYALENPNTFTTQSELEAIEFKSYQAIKTRTVFETVYLFNKPTLRRQYKSQKIVALALK